MREIKFRAWHEKDGRFINWTTIISVMDKVGGGGSHFFKTGGYILMQYTGLKDKNGKEIYEGDICRTYSKEYPRDKEVVWDNGMACFRFDYPLGKSIMQEDSIEVIGNIYETPELLNSVITGND